MYSEWAIIARFNPQLRKCHAIPPHRRSYTVDPAPAIFTGNPGMKCVMERYNELREVDIQAAFDVDKHNSGEYVMV